MTSTSPNGSFNNLPRRACPTKTRSKLSTFSTSLLINITLIHSTSSSCNPCDIVPNGFTSVPGTECSQYVSCMNGEEVANEICGAGLLFDMTITGCNWDYAVTCPPDASGCEGISSSDAPIAENITNNGDEQSQSNCDTPLCKADESGTVIVPFSSCQQYVQCSFGVPGVIASCPEGQIYSLQIQACNVIGQVTCPPEPSCSPAITPTIEPKSLSPTVTVGNSPAPSEFPTKTKNITSEGEKSTSLEYQELMEGMYVIDAHLDANKILIARELLNGGRPRSTTSPTFKYDSFKNSLHTMIKTPINDQTFYVGQLDLPNGHLYGLVNIAAFLSQSEVDSIQFGSCDEANTHAIHGELPISNACGQNGVDYLKSSMCSADDEKYACQVDGDMRVQGVKSFGEGPPAFFCGPANDYGGFTGFWDYATNTENKDNPVQNAIGKTDVQGCCWWGRGAIHTRGVCQYGKLNHFLGKKASDEGRSAMFPDVDFCKDPGAICANEKYPDLKWIAGLFRWVNDVQTYSVDEFSYMEELINFVDSGLTDWSFIYRVSGIVTQGCHKTPCVEGAEFDGLERKEVFVKTLKLFGLNVNSAGAQH